MTYKAFIESQFPVNRISKESYKERKANNSQTLTGLGKWWGRKPLVLVRATIVSLLLPSTDDPEKDLEIFLKLMTMDDESLLARKDKNIPLEEMIGFLSEEEKNDLFDFAGGKYQWKKGTDRSQKITTQELVFKRMTYDEKLNYCLRPEQLTEIPGKIWEDINLHCGTNAKSLSDWVEQMGKKHFGAPPKVGDSFCGGGSIPFEAARIGCEAYGSDLNPVAALLSWASLNIVGGGEDIQNKVTKAQLEVFEKVDKQITEWGIEHNEMGWRAEAYLYCIEAKSPATGYWVPLAPSWVISEKTRTCAVLKPDHVNKRYLVEVVAAADMDTYNKAKEGTVKDNDLVCPEDENKTYKISTLRGDRNIDGKTKYGLRLWENEDVTPRPDDVFQERLYCIRYAETYYKVKKNFETEGKQWSTSQELSLSVANNLANLEELLEKGVLKKESRKHYLAPDENDLRREALVRSLLNERLFEWQEKGFIPSAKIPREGDKTEEPIRTRGWTHWHHLFNPRQLLLHGLFFEKFSKDKDKINFVAFLLGAGKLANWNSRLTRWLADPANEKGSDVFTNQALNTFFNYSTRPFSKLNTVWLYNISKSPICKGEISTADARQIKEFCHFWITDPPYADAVNYHELGDFFLAWYEKHLPGLFPEWYSDSRAGLAVKGSGKNFNQNMVEIYSSLCKNMPDNGAQVIMFTHQDSKVWADLALIVWAAGLKVTAAWTIQTETDAGGIKKGSYVQGTVIMVLRKRLNNEMGFLSDIYQDIEYEVKQQLDFMTALDEGEEPNFSDPDYQLAAYAAALKVLTQYESIESIDIKWELEKERAKNEENPVNQIIVDALKVAMDYMVPSGYSEASWRLLSPEERFYMKGLVVEAGQEYRSGVYTEMARGFGLRDYKYMLHTAKANQTRLKTPGEFKTSELFGEGFGSSLLRHILYALYAVGQEERPASGRDFLYSERKSTYWQERKRVIEILQFIIQKTESIPHWKKDRESARLLIGYLENDTAS